MTPLPELLGIRVEFFLFALTLLGVVLLHRRAMHVALTGLVVISLYKIAIDPSFHVLEHYLGSEGKEGEWRILLNLMGLLVGFAVLTRHFDLSRLPQKLPDFLPDGWGGGFVLLAMVFALSSFLDNIAAAMIGGTIAHVVFRHRIHVGYAAAIVAASNAGGAGSVVGDTTTTMMWIEGVPALSILPAYAASIPALLVFGTLAARQQDRFNRIAWEAPRAVVIEWGRVLVVALILAGTIATNILLDFPALGVWLGIALGATFTSTPWNEVPRAVGGAAFLLSLVACASMMPVSELPPASWSTAFGLGLVSSLFDNIPLTKLALEQGGYDWAMLAYAVGFGGSMLWFGSSAGVALSHLVPEIRNTGAYLRHGWHVALAYVVGFLVLLGIAGWNPS